MPQSGTQDSQPCHPAPAFTTHGDWSVAKASSIQITPPCGLSDLPSPHRVSRGHGAQEHGFLALLIARNKIVQPFTAAPPKLVGT